MNYFIKQYKEMCKQEFGQYGFKSYRNNHYRVINDIFQSFSLHRSIYGHDATVEFCIRSLADDYTIDKSTCGADHLKRFENSAAWFPYDNRYKATIDVCIENMKAYMKKYLIPFFESATTTETAYRVICDFDENNNHSQLNEDTKLIFSLKNQQYSLAEIHMENMISQAENAYKRNKEVYEDKMSREYQEYIEKMEKCLAERGEFLQHIINKDNTFFQEWLKKNEERNLKSLGMLKK